MEEREREYVDSPLYMCIYGTIDERDDGREKKKRSERERGEERRKIDEQSLSVLFTLLMFLKWTTEK